MCSVCASLPVPVGDMAQSRCTASIWNARVNELGGPGGAGWGVGRSVKGGVQERAGEIVWGPWSGEDTHSPRRSPSSEARVPVWLMLGGVGRLALGLCLAHECTSWTRGCVF